MIRGEVCEMALAHVVENTTKTPDVTRSEKYLSGLKGQKHHMSEYLLEWQNGLMASLVISVGRMVFVKCE